MAATAHSAGTIGEYSRNCGTPKALVGLPRTAAHPIAASPAPERHDAVAGQVAAVHRNGGHARR